MDSENVVGNKIIANPLLIHLNQSQTILGTLCMFHNPLSGLWPKSRTEKMYNRRKSRWQKGRRRIHKVSAGVRPGIFGPMRWCSLCCVFRQATALPLANLFASCFVCDMTGRPEKSPILSNWKGAPCSHCSGIRQSLVNKLIRLSCLYTGTRLQSN